MIIKDKNKSHQSSLLLGPNGFLKSSNLLHLFSVQKSLVVLTFKNVLF